jgi:hypothetical protein
MKKKGLVCSMFRSLKTVACCEFLASCLDEWLLATTGTNTFGAIEHVREVKWQTNGKRKNNEGGKNEEVLRKREEEKRSHPA